jgi:hypothetical protein
MLPARQPPRPTELADENDAEATNRAAVPMRPPGWPSADSPELVRAEGTEAGPTSFSGRLG